MSRIPLSFSAFNQASRRTQLLLIGAGAFTATATISYATSSNAFATAKESAHLKPTFGSVGFRTLKLDSVEQLNHDTKRFRFALPEGVDSVSGLKLTSALLSMSWPKGDWTPVVRPYTPVSDLNDPGHIDFVIKHYPSGRQSSHVHSLTPGSTLTFFAYPLPPGYKWTPNKHDHVLLIAGGAGITPIYQLTKGILNNAENERTKITLVWGTNTDADVFFRDEFDALTKKFPGRFSAHYTVSRATPPQQGTSQQYPVGRVTKDFLQDIMRKEGFDVSKDGSMVFLCGPPAMEKAMVDKKTGALQELGIGKGKLHQF